jgi:hypothetical protein
MPLHNCHVTRALVPGDTPSNVDGDWTDEELEEGAFDPVDEDAAADPGEDDLLPHGLKWTPFDEVDRVEDGVCKHSSTRSTPTAKMGFVRAGGGRVHLSVGGCRPTARRPRLPACHEDHPETEGGGPGDQ